LTWNVLFGAIWVTKNGQHLNAEVYLHHKFNERQICLIDSILELIIAVVTAVIAYRSARFAFISMNFSIVALSWLKLGYVFIVMPLAMLAMSFYYFKNFFNKIRLIFKND
jgi:TRAP-type C4-dicarboxylate transport system permease small subunit